MKPTPAAQPWLTSTRHRSSYARGEPFGTEHARVLGSSHTACGTAAHSWRLIWDRPFEPSSKHACPDCARVVRGQLGPLNRTTSL